MKFMDFDKTYDDTKKIVEQNLLRHIDTVKASPQTKIYESMKYSLEAGGKRFRPILFLQTINLLGGSKQKHMDIACALEYIHTYSLIHDDLPAMDNDEYRRGKKTNHIVFGEDIAILAGDGLLNTAYEILFAYIVNNATKPVAKAALCIAQGAGTDGMIGGQVVDIASENKQISAETLHYIHEKKTGSLIEASVLSAAYIMEASETQIAALKVYAQNLGLAFQIADDILDVTGSFEALGKAIGSDAKNDKTTYITLYGAENAKQLLEEAVENAIQALEIFPKGETEFLTSLAKYVANRNN